jgi:hypothetical protein
VEGSNFPKRSVGTHVGDSAHREMVSGKNVLPTFATQADNVKRRGSVSPKRADGQDKRPRRSSSTAQSVAMQLQRQHKNVTGRAEGPLTLSETQQHARHVGSVNLASADFEFEDAIHGDAREIAHLVGSAIGPVFPVGASLVQILEDDNLKATGETFYENATKPKQAFIHIRPDVLQKPGEFALTLAHEIFLHAARDIAAFNNGRPLESSDEQHNLVVTPASDDNPYLNVVRKVLAELPDADNGDLKDEFLSAYLDDLDAHMPLDADEESLAWQQRVTQEADDYTREYWVPKY